MQTLIKLLISVGVIFLCSQIGKRLPSLAGLIATMPLTGMLVLVWLYNDTQENNELMINYTKGALWGILPSILFFLTAYFCFRRHLSLSAVLTTSFIIWGLAAAVHQWLLR